MDDLETYQQENHRKSVLLFPPLPSRLRYLIHRTVEDMLELTTFSVGESWCRQVVVCHSELRSESDEVSDSESNGCCCEEPLSRKVEVEASVKPKPPGSSQSRGPKRPDQPLYMPRAARERLSLQNSQGSTPNKDLESSAHCKISSPPDSCSCSETTGHTKYSSSSSVQNLCAEGVENKGDNCTNSSWPCLEEKTQKLSLRLQENEALVWDQTQSSFTEMNLDDEKSGEFICLSENIQTEDREADDLIEQIKAHLYETDSVSVRLAHNDYSVYESVSFNSDDFRHVIEIYDFPSMFKTDDLLDAFTGYSDGGMKIRWVDDIHALGVFSSEAAALHALSICHPLLKTRALSEGSKKAKGKAVRGAEFIQPVKERPRTDCAVAKRMVTRALGIRGRGQLKRY